MFFELSFKLADCAVVLLERCKLVGILGIFDMKRLLLTNICGSEPFSRTDVAVSACKSVQVI